MRFRPYLLVLIVVAACVQAAGSDLRSPADVSAGNTGGPWTMEGPGALFQVHDAGITLDVHRHHSTVWESDLVVVEWSIRGATHMQHGEVHWGRDPALLNRSAEGRPVEAIPATDNDTAVRPENSSRATFGPFEPAETIYYAVHVIADSVSLTVGPIELRVLNDQEPPLPALPGWPLPGATNVSVNVALSWNATDANADIEAYDVYLGADAHPGPYAMHHTSTSIAPTGLRPQKTYYWKVETRDAYGHRVMSDTWNFTTGYGQGDPMAAFTYTVEGQIVHFDGSSSHSPSGEPLAFTWDFGDGGVAHGERVSHEYRLPGGYDVRLTVTTTVHGAQHTSGSCVSVMYGACA